MAIMKPTGLLVDSVGSACGNLAVLDLHAKLAESTVAHACQDPVGVTIASGRGAAITPSVPEPEGCRPGAAITPRGPAAQTG